VTFRFVSPRSQSSEVIALSTNKSPTTSFWDTTHQTPIFDDWRGYSGSACPFSTLNFLLFWLLICAFRWNRASFVKTKWPPHKPLLVKMSCCQLQKYCALGVTELLKQLGKLVSKRWTFRLNQACSLHVC
jgi:hypothetical protein